MRDRGDAALRELTERFDGCRIDDLRVPDRRARRPPSTASRRDVRAALEYAAGEIAAYHAAQRDGGFTLDRDGVRLTERVVPVAGPGATCPAAGPPTRRRVLMTAIPARSPASPRSRCACRPAPTARSRRSTLAAAALAGVDEVYRVGGAQAIAAHGLRHRVDPRRST